MLIHSQTPPGISVMRRLKGQIKYRFEELPTGARIQITTTNAEALTVIHQFSELQPRGARKNRGLLGKQPTARELRWRRHDARKELALL
jgi:hypothetical protein